MIARGSGSLVVREVRHEAEGILAFRLVSPGAELLPEWQPGAHIELTLRSGLTRQYSLCSNPSDLSFYEICVLRNDTGGGGSRELHSSIEIGDRIIFRGPRNNFRLLPATSYLFLAGGIGITPILPMARRATEARVKWKLIYGGRRRKSMAFIDKLVDLRGDFGEVQTVFEDEVGLPDFENAIYDADDGAGIYACGPELMLLNVEALCQRNLRLNDLHQERFSSSRQKVERGGVLSNAFKVGLKRTGVTLTVPQDRTILEVIRDQIPDVPSACERGYCGACEQKVLSGCPDHRDTVLTDDERTAGKKIMICVSRSRSPLLVLDL